MGKLWSSASGLLERPALGAPAHVPEHPLVNRSSSSNADALRRACNYGASRPTVGIFVFLGRSRARSSSIATRILNPVIRGGAMTRPIQHIGNTILLVMMDVEEGHEAEFDRWYNEEHLPERMEIPGYVSARRFKLEEGNGVLKYLCIWEMEDASPLESEMYRSQRARPSWIREEANKYITQRARGLYKQVYPLE